jgi:hypothetical protein
LQDSILWLFFIAISELVDWRIRIDRMARPEMGSNLVLVVLVLVVPSLLLGIFAR